MMRAFWILIVISGLLCACQHSPRKNYYVLTAPVTEVPSTPLVAEKLIGIGPIALADYLQRLHMVYETNDTRLAFAANDYWAEPLTEGIPRVLALNLVRADNARSFVSFPWRSDTQPRYSLRLQLQGLYREEGKVGMNMTWELFDNLNQRELIRRHFIHTIPAQAGAGGLADACSKLLAQLAGEMDQVLTQSVSERSVSEQ